MPRVAAILCLLVLVGCGTSHAAAPLNPTYVISGHGWGHGIGMSQYGAYGYAQHGWTYDQILAHYYTDTTLGPAPMSKVRVLLATGKAALTVSSTVPFKLTDGSKKTRTLAPGTFRVAPGPLVVNPAGVTLATTGPLTFSPGSEPLSLGKAGYRGSLLISSIAGKLQAVNSVGVDPYVQGVVSREMPSSWDLEALKTQAVAARSYALANLQKGGAFDLYADTRSQVYGGVAAETDATNEAVADTAGEVVLYNGVVADTFFSSTSGGRTAAVEDVWPDAEPAPYLVSVPDPYDSISPYHNWGPTALSAAAVARALHVPGTLLDLKTSLNPSARVATLTAVGTIGKIAVTGTDARSLLGLKSSWFRIGVLGQLATKVKSLEYGAKATLTGLERALPTAVVQTRAPGGVWKALPPFKPGSSGAFSVTVQPQATTEYRLATGKTGGAPTRITVTPRVRLYAVTDPAHIRGYARPILPGAKVQIQITDGTTWTTVGSALLDAKGVFDATVTPLAGTYRALLAPGHGLAAGASPPVEVSG